MLDATRMTATRLAISWAPFGQTKDVALAEVAAAERVIKAAQQVGVDDPILDDLEAALRDLAALKDAD